MAGASTGSLWTEARCCAGKRLSMLTHYSRNAPTRCSGGGGKCRSRRVQSGRGDLMASGAVKWFNMQKGYGFIAPDDGGPDAFAHISVVLEAGLPELREASERTCKP